MNRNEGLRLPPLEIEAIIRRDTEADGDCKSTRWREHFMNNAKLSRHSTCVEAVDIHNKGLIVRFLCYYVHIGIIHTGTVRKQCFDSFTLLRITTVEIHHHVALQIPTNEHTRTHDLSLHTAKRHVDCKKTHLQCTFCRDFRHGHILAARSWIQNLNRNNRRKKNVMHYIRYKLLKRCHTGRVCRWHRVNIPLKHLPRIWVGCTYDRSSYTSCAGLMCTQH